MQSDGLEFSQWLNFYLYIVSGDYCDACDLIVQTAKHSNPIHLQSPIVNGLFFWVLQIIQITQMYC